MQQRVQEEESEKVRQDNLTLNRRLDRLGRVTNDLKISFVSLVGSNLAHPLESNVNQIHLQTVSALTDRALAVKVKVEPRYIRSLSISVILLNVCMYVCIQLCTNEKSCILVVHRWFLYTYMEEIVHDM